MQNKTIKKVLSEKIKDWANSITDGKVKEVVLKHSIVTGGCIASMLLKEEVNDYDIYMDSKEAVLAVANYYAKIGGVAVIDGDKVDLSDVDITEDHIGQYNYACLGIDSERVKFFIRDTAVKIIEPVEGAKYQPICFSPNAVTLSDKIQVVVRFHGNPEEIHKNYDFVHATSYFYEGALILRKEALESLLQKRLVYIGSKYPICSIIRSKKFILRGYSISAGTYFKMCYQVSKLDLDDTVVLEDQLAGVDSMYFMTLISALSSKKEKDPQFVPTYEYISEIIDRVFEGV